MYGKEECGNGNDTSEECCLAPNCEQQVLIAVIG